MNVKFKQWDCTPTFGQYRDNDRTAIKLIDAETGEPIATATINLPECQLGDDEVIIKDYSENEGMLDALVKANIVEATGMMVQSGHVTCPVVKLIITP